MVLTLTSIITAASGLFTTYATVRKAYTTVKEIKNGMAIDLPDGVKKLDDGSYGQEDIKSGLGRTLSKEEVNTLKRNTAISLLERYILPKIEYRGGKPADMGVLVDFSCVVYRLIRGKKS